MSAFAIPGLKRKPKEPKRELPAPLVNPARHPIIWAKQRVGLTLALVVGAHIGTLIIVAIYYLLFETYGPFTQAWHSAVSNSDLRHNIRGVGEGLLGGTLGQLLVFNAFKKTMYKKPNFLDRIEIKLHLPNNRDDKQMPGWMMLISPLIIIFYAIPGFVLGEVILHGVFHVAAFTGNADYLQKASTQNWDQKVIGLFASLFLGRRPIRVLANDVQLWFAERRVQMRKPCRPWHTPVFKARVTDVIQRGATECTDISHNGLAATLMVGAVFVGLCLAAFGFHVLNDIAK